MVTKQMNSNNKFLKFQPFLPLFAVLAVLVYGGSSSLTNLDIPFIIAVPTGAAIGLGVVLGMLYAFVIPVMLVVGIVTCLSGQSGERRKRFKRFASYPITIASMAAILMVAVGWVGQLGVLWWLLIWAVLAFGMRLQEKRKPLFINTPDADPTPEGLPLERFLSRFVSRIWSLMPKPGQEAREQAAKEAAEKASLLARLEEQEVQIAWLMDERAKLNERVTELQVALARETVRSRSASKRRQRPVDAAYKTVGLDPHCPDFLVGAAQASFRRNHHPDRFVGNLEEQARAERLFKDAEQAFGIIRRERGL
ncbi:hypothetical protein [Benzoatithermus flavus]|uniref:J domain-containing protein n=1 Tax=Benzoatithermus flavus TaxID=3108223 RepID=A0ABU8XTC9_9PROT